MTICFLPLPNGFCKRYQGRDIKAITREWRLDCVEIEFLMLLVRRGHKVVWQ